MSGDARVPHSHWVASRGGLPFGNYALFRSRRCPPQAPCSPRSGSEGALGCGTGALARREAGGLPRVSK